MKSIFVVLMFLGIIMMMHAYYEDKYVRLKTSQTKTKYKFIPRSDYDEVLFGQQAFEKNRAIFGENPTIGGRME
jgi:hypothetical protein